MLVYHPAFDLYNCMFRILLILENIKIKEVELEKVLIWDYYVTFPYKITEFKFTRDSVSYRKIFRSINVNPYDIVEDDKKVFYRMRSYQLSALRSLVSYGLIDPILLSKAKVKRTDKEIPNGIVEQFNKVPVRIKNVIELISSPFSNLPLYGDSGFKARTKLLEYRYDTK